MKNYLMSLALGLMAYGAMADELPVVPDAAQSAVVQDVVPGTPSTEVTAMVEAPAPDGIVTERHPLKKAYLVKASRPAAKFRPSKNMPEVVNEDLLRGMSETGKEPGKTSDFIGYLPALRVVKGADQKCDDSDYEKAVAAFVNGFSGDTKHFKQRGELIVEVRWCNTRPFLARALPFGADVFAVSFVLEGKLVTLGTTTMMGSKVTTAEIARELGARMSLDFAYVLGVGARPTFLTPMGSDALNTAMSATQAVRSAAGAQDVRSRIEPATAAQAYLLPAVDGIKPGEIDPVAEMHYLNNALY